VGGEDYFDDLKSLKKENEGILKKLQNSE